MWAGSCRSGHIVFRLNTQIRIISDFHLFIAARLLDVADTVDGHVILGDEGGDFQLIHVDDVVQVFDTGDRVDFVFNGWGHEREEPPSHDLFTSRRKTNENLNKMVSIKLLTFVQKVG